MIESDDSGNRMRTAGQGAVAVIDGLWGDIRQLAVSQLLSPEETEAMILFIKDMRNLDQLLASDSGQKGMPRDRNADMLELRGMIGILQDDISRARMRITF